VRRFIDATAEFFYVPPADVRAFAAANDARPYDIPDVDYSHVGPECSFDAFIRHHALSHPALDALANIVRAADTSTLDRSPQAPGLLAASLGLSAMFTDDHAMLKWGMLVYDSLYAWCRRVCQDGQDETHGWYPEKLRVQGRRECRRCERWSRRPAPTVPPRQRPRARKRSATGSSSAS
jgi:hypothetical protein